MIKKFFKLIFFGVATLFVSLSLLLFIISYNLIGSFTGKGTGSNGRGKIKLDTQSTISDEKPSFEIKLSPVDFTSQDKVVQANTSDTAFAEKIRFIEYLEKTKENLLTKENPPDICAFLCNQSKFKNNRKENEDFLKYTTNFLEEEQDRAFEDPDFFMLYAKIDTSVVKIFSPKTRTILWKIQELKSKEIESSEAEKVFLAAQLYRSVLETIFSMPYLISEGKERLNELERLKHLQRNCSSESPSEIYKKCLDVGYRF